MILRAIFCAVLALAVSAGAVPALAGGKPANVLAVFHDCGATAVGEPSLLRADYRPSIDDPRHLGRQTVEYVSIVSQCERTVGGGAYVPAGLRVDLFGPCDGPVPCPIGTTVLTPAVDETTFAGTLHDDIGFRVLQLGTNRADALVLRVKTRVEGGKYGPMADYLLYTHDGPLAAAEDGGAVGVGCLLLPGAAETLLPVATRPDAVTR